MDSVALDRVGERSHHVLLADDLVEGLGAVAAIERIGRLAGHRAESSGAVHRVLATESALCAFCADRSRAKGSEGCGRKTECELPTDRVGTLFRSRRAPRGATGRQ